MFRRKTKSALLVDFDNIVGATNGDFGRKIPNWMAWLEDGKFDGGRSRRNFLVKRVYWHAQNDGYRSAFEGNGFEAITCRSFVDNKSTADMIIALDALELTYGQKTIQEYVLLTTDTDFVPLVEKLGNRSKQTVNAGNRDNLSYGVFSDHADIVIAIDALKGAFRYERKKSLFNRLKDRWRQAREHVAKRKADRDRAESRGSQAQSCGDRADRKPKSAHPRTGPPKSTGGKSWWQPQPSTLPELAHGLRGSKSAAGRSIAHWRIICRSTQRSAGLHILVAAVTTRCSSSSRASAAICGCTSIIVGAAASASGRRIDLLWETHLFTVTQRGGDPRNHPRAIGRETWIPASRGNDTRICARDGYLLSSLPIFGQGRAVSLCSASTCSSAWATCSTWASAPLGPITWMPKGMPL